MQNSFANESPTGALARGLRLLAALNDLETATISGLVKETNLPKATVIRLLQALQAEGYAAQDTDTLTYHVTPKVASSVAFADRQESNRGSDPGGPRPVGGRRQMAGRISRPGRVVDVDSVEQSRTGAHQAEAVRAATVSDSGKRGRGVYLSELERRSSGANGSNVCSSPRRRSRRRSAESRKRPRPVTRRARSTSWVRTCVLPRCSCREAAAPFP